MGTLTRRVQVLLSPKDHEQLEALAQAHETSIGALIRQAVEQTYFKPNETERLQAVQHLAQLQLPVADWEQMERESTPEFDLD